MYPFIICILQQYFKGLEQPSPKGSWLFLLWTKTILTRCYLKNNSLFFIALSYRYFSQEYTNNLVILVSVTHHFQTS